MSIIIASNFGNLGIFIIVLPALALALLSGLIAAAGRVRWLSIISSVICFLAAALLFWSLSNLDTRARAETQFLVVASLCLGFLLLLPLRLPRR